VEPNKQRQLCAHRGSPAPSPDREEPAAAIGLDEHAPFVPCLSGLTIRTSLMISELVDSGHGVSVQALADVGRPPRSPHARARWS